MTENEVSRIIVDAAYKIHTTLGPGLLESVYEAVLTHELENRGCRAVRQQAIPVVYESVQLEVGFRADLIVNNKVIVEIKSVETVSPTHLKQLRTYLRLADKRLGLLINFNVELIKNGIRRVVNQLWFSRKTREENFMKTFFISAFVLFSAIYIQAQTTKIAAPKTTVSPQKSSPAYAELLLRHTERESELEELLIGYTEEFPKVKELRFEIGLLKIEMDRIAATNASDAAKLSLPLGKLLVREIELETDLWNLKKQYNDDHPEVKRARRKIEVFRRAIKEILP